MDNLNDISLKPVNDEITKGGDAMENQMISFSSNLERQNPEVIKKALDQVPEIVKTSSEAIGGIKDVTKNVLQSNDNSVNHVYDNIDKNAEAIRKIMAEGNLSEEALLKMADKLLESDRTAAEVDNRNKEFLDKTVTKSIIGNILAVTIPAAIVSIGFSLVFKVPLRTK